MPKNLQLVLNEKEQITEDLFRLRFVPANGAMVDFLPGQFMSLEVKPSIRRSYSIANPPSEGHYLETFADNLAGGPGSQFVTGVKVGQRVNALIPLGKFVYEHNPLPAYFFSTGTGVVPFLSMIRHALGSPVSQTAGESRERRMTLYYGVRDESRIILHDLIKDLAQENPSFEAHVFLSEPYEEWKGPVGRITSAIGEIIDPNLVAYICGGREVVFEVEEMLKSKGVKEENIKYERFY